jgi:hypothetical protein
MKYRIGLLFFVSALSTAGEFSPVDSPVERCQGNFFTQKALVLVLSQAGVVSYDLRHYFSHNDYQFFRPSLSVRHHPSVG